MQYLTRPEREHVFARAVLTITWNLMSRIGNGVSLCYSHLEWNEDHLGVYFVHQKNDQEGARPRDPKNVYANPLQPEICPILALAIYWLVFPPTFTSKDANPHIFPGSNQEERFRKALMAIIKTTEGEQQLLSRQIAAEDIGTHSIRKGSATFSTAVGSVGVSTRAVYHRAGWSVSFFFFPFIFFLLF